MSHPRSKYPASTISRIGAWIKKVEWSMAFAKVGIWLFVLSFGGIFWAINGGFSVAGLRVIANSFNEAGQIFWSIISRWTVHIDVPLPGITTRQPVIPWLGVISASMLQITYGYRRVRKKETPLWLTLSASLLSIYDYITTFVGMETVEWLASLGWLLRAILALGLTFALEATIVLLSRRSPKEDSHERNRGRNLDRLSDGWPAAGAALAPEPQRARQSIALGDRQSVDRLLD